MYLSRSLLADLEYLAEIHSFPKTDGPGAAQASSRYGISYPTEGKHEGQKNLQQPQTSRGRYRFKMSSFDRASLLGNPTLRNTYDKIKV